MRCSSAFLTQLSHLLLLATGLMTTNLQSDVHFEGVATFCVQPTVYLQKCNLLPELQSAYNRTAVVLLFPGSVPWISFSKQFPGFLITCPELTNAATPRPSLVAGAPAN